MNLSKPNYMCVDRVLGLLSKMFSSDKSDLPQAPPTENLAEQKWNDLVSSTRQLQYDSVEDFQDALEHTIESRRTSSVLTESSQILTKIDFKFGEASFSLYDVDESGSSRMIAMFEATGIKTQIEAQKYETQLSMTIAALKLEDSAVDATDFRYLLTPETTSNSSNLISINCMYIAPKGSKGGHTNIVLSTTPIRFNFVQECLLRINKFFTSLTEDAVHLMSPVSDIETPTKSSLPSASPKAETISTNSVAIKIDGVSIILVENRHSVCTTFIESMVLNLKSSGARLYVNGILGKIEVKDDMNNDFGILTVDESKTGEFTFEKFDASKSIFDSALNVSAASIRLIYKQEFIARISNYFDHFQEMQAVLDNARLAAQESAAQMQKSAGKTKFSITLKTPIIELPNPENDSERITLYLGKINAKSVDVLPSNIGKINDKIALKISSLKMQTSFIGPESSCTMNIVEDINMDVKLNNFNGDQNTAPVQQILISTSEITMKLSDHQYALCMHMLKVLGSSPPSESDEKDGLPSDKPVGLPLMRAIEMNMPHVSLEMFWKTDRLIDPTVHTLAKLVGSTSCLKFQTEGGDTVNMEWRFRSLSMFDTRTNSTNVFREMLVPMNEIEDQFVLKSYLKGPASDYLISIDRAKLVLEMDHLFAVRAFATYPFQNSSNEKVLESDSVQNDSLCRVSFIDPEITIVRDPLNPSSDAAVLQAAQLEFKLDEITLVSFNKLSMSFCAMDAREETMLCFLDDSDLTIVLDSQESIDYSMYNVSIDTSKLLFRVSYQDMLLLNDLYSRITGGGESNQKAIDNNELVTTVSKQQKESLRVNLGGIQAVIIDDLDDLHQPMFELDLDPMAVEVLNWSTQVNQVYLAYF